MDRHGKFFSGRSIWDTNIAAMDAVERKILAAFDAPGAGALAFAGISGDPVINDRLQQLVRRGWLRCGAEPGTFLRTEEGACNSQHRTT